MARASGPADAVCVPRLVYAREALGPEALDVR